MKITEITVRAGRTINHPIEQYANLRPGIELRAQIEDGDDWHRAVIDLQRSAEQLVERQSQEITDAILQRNEMEHEARELSRLTRDLTSARERLEAEQKRFDELQEKAKSRSRNGLLIVPQQADPDVLPSCESEDYEDDYEMDHP